MSNIVLSQAKKLAESFGIEGDAQEIVSILKATAFRSDKGEVSDAQLAALLIVAGQYGLNPWTKEIYAFPDKKNGIVPVVGVDGWSRIINEHPQFDGMEFRASETMIRMPGANVDAPEWMEAVIYRKDRSRPTVVREYLDEVYREPFKGQYGVVVGPWQTHTKRFLRHKTSIQSSRLAFGFGGIYDQDEAERIVEGKGPERFMGAVDEVKPESAVFPPERFIKNLPEWRKAIAMSKATADSVVAKARTIGVLTPEQEAAIRAPLTDAEKAVTKPAAQQVTDVQPKEYVPPLTAATTVTDNLEQRLRDAADLDALYTVGDLIGEVPDPEQRAALTAVFEERQFALEAN